MNQPFYLERELFNNDKTYSETELLKASNYIVVLAEPGGGKTELLKSLAKKLGSKEVTASVFSYVGAHQVQTPLVIDAFDELAKVDKTGIHKLLANVSRANPTKVIISSRSSEWDSSATSTFKQFIGYQPLVARLCEFEEPEQTEIFKHYANGDDFKEFQAEVAKFALEPLLPNPQFLKMFADAYIESSKHFTDKRSIFSQAVTHLAKEVNVSSGASLPSDKKISLSSEIFAKLLLSGAEGVAVSEVSENRMYPLIGSLLTSEPDTNSVLATRLFKPGENADQHRPVHKIVAEYCAADYLIKRIANPSDPLTFSQCLPIIAPNSIVRDELRGLLGWLAALGDKSIEESAIELDSYAVLANGDPSQLSPSSKSLLLSRLKEVEASDPYFRRGDFWRRFSVAGFFTYETVEDIRPIITDNSDGHLRCLLLELLVGSNASRWLVKELRQLLLASNEETQTRLLAANCLLTVVDYDIHSDFKELIDESSNSSLRIAAEIIKTLGSENISFDEFEMFFRSCSSIYPNREERREGGIGDRYFVKRVISLMALPTIERLLDALSKGLVCTCGEQAFKCDCRTGVSKIIGTLLDRFFELAASPFDPIRVWQWIENLNYPDSYNTSNVHSVKFLQKETALRQGIVAHIFGGLTDREQIFQAKVHKCGHFSHAGLRLCRDDQKFIVDLAFETNNFELWVSFIPRHNFHREQEDLFFDELRRHMRVQASQKPEFMRRWSLQNRTMSILDKKEDREWNRKQRRLAKRRNKKKAQIHKENIQFVQENRTQVEGGKHWSCLVRFAELALNNPKKIELEFGDEKLVRNALKNCLDFIEPVVPNMQRLVELKCASKGTQAETVLVAACFEIMRDNGSLEGVNYPLLVALRTNLNVGYFAIEPEERDALRSEVDRLLFPDTESAELFLRQYVEPQLANAKCSHPEVSLLGHDEPFSSLRAKLSIEWLSRFNMREPYVLDSLFEIAAQYGDREKLKEIISASCSEIVTKWSTVTDDEKPEEKRRFWFLRAFYFLNTKLAKPYLILLSSDKNSVLMFDQRSGRMARHDYSYWPELTSEKIEAIFDAYFEQWPKVNLPSNWGSESPIEETAYRFLTGLIWSIGNDDHDAAIPVLNRLLADRRFSDIDRELKSIQSEQLRKKALVDFEPPNALKVVDLLDHNAIVTVEGLRQLVVQELSNYQKVIDGGEFNSASRFYTNDKNGCDTHLNEVKSVEIIAERLSMALHPQSIIVTPEHQTKNQNRIDITASKMIEGKRRLLVIEAKGQWHAELYSAASAQLFERYSIHPDAEHQGIYLVIWFGETVEVAGRKRHKIRTAQDLKVSIEKELPAELRGLIDVFVLDVSRPS